MPKKKKTLKQKIVSDTRQQKKVEPIIAVSLPVQPVHPVQQTSKPIALSTSAYAYLLHDLRKTFLLTLAIVVLELALMIFFEGR